MPDFIAPPESPGPLDRIRWILVTNGAAEAIPGHALVRVTGSTADGGFTVAQPNADNLPNLMVMGPMGIEVGGVGIATFDEPTPVRYNDAATPAAGETWGSASGSWLLTTGKTGWRVVGDPNGSNRVMAVRAASGVLNTQNVNGTQIDATTVDIRADQTTFVEFQQLTSPDRTRLFLNIPELSDGLVMDQSLTVVTSGCVELVVVQTKNGSGYVTNVTVTPRVYLTTRNITLLSGSTIGPAVCVNDPVCCDPQPPLFSGCARQFPALIYVTMSAPTGTCGCFTGTFPLAWDPYSAGGQYRGTFTGCTGNVNVDVIRSGADWNVTWSGSSYTFDSGTVSQFWTFVCNPVASGNLTMTVDAGSCVGGFTFSVGE